MEIIIMAKTMIDIHSHIISNIDDGCKSIDDSLKTIKQLKELGFSKIVLTPHYMKGSNYQANNDIKITKYNKLKEIVKKENIDIDLYLGNEIYINNDISNLIINKEIYPLNDTKYLLIELPLFNEINGVEDYLYELKLNGYIPIIAHPERYLYFQKNYKKIVELYESGVLYQSNYGSILGLYGKEAKKLLKYALKKDMISFLATDIHSPNSSLIKDFKKAIKKIKRIVGSKRFEDLTFNNANKVIDNKKVEYFE